MRNICVNYFKFGPVVQEEMLFESLGVEQNDLCKGYAPVICIHCFHFSEPWYKPPTPCGDKLMVTTLLLAPPYTTENLTGGKCLNFISPTLPRHCVLALHNSPAIPLLSP